MSVFKEPWEKGPTECESEIKRQRTVIKAKNDAIVSLSDEITRLQALAKAHGKYDWCWSCTNNGDEDACDDCNDAGPTRYYD
jgi:hypothetical protein